MIKAMAAVIAALMMVAGILASDARAGDQTSTYFTADSALISVGFKGRACGAIPMPDIYLDGERNCAKVPNTYLYKLERNDGTVVKEIRKLEDTWASTTVTETVTETGAPVSRTETMNVTSGRSVFGSFGKDSRWGLDDLTSALASADSAAATARFFSTGLAAVRTSEGGSAYLEKANSLLPGNQPSAPGSPGQ